MFLKRNVKASIKAWLDNLFENPSADNQTAGIPEYNVYGESEMRDESHVGTYPFVYITDGAIPYEEKKLPAVVIDCDTVAGTNLELGNTNRMHIWDVAFHVWGNTRGERDDLSWFIEKNLSTITIYDYTPDTPTLIETVRIDPDIGVAEARVGDEQMEEGSLLNWAIITCTFETMN